MQFKVACRCRPSSSPAWAQASRSARSVLDGQAYAELVKPSSYVKPMTYGAVAPGLFDAHRRRHAAPPLQSPHHSTKHRAGGRRMNLLGKLSWDAIPFHEPIPLITSPVVIVVVIGVLILGVAARAGGPICGTSTSPPPTTSASASCTSCWRC